MKILFVILSDDQVIDIEADESSTIKSILIITNQINISADENDFIYNKNICDVDKTLKELDIIDNSKIYVIKKSKRSLKRELKNDAFNSLYNFGSLPKKCCSFNVDGNINKKIWQNKSLNEIQNEMNDIIQQHPQLMESILAQPRVESVINNPSLVSSFYSANPEISQLMENRPDRFKFFTDESQYRWMKNILEDLDQIDRQSLLDNYSDNFKSIMDSKRYRRMREAFESANNDKVGEEESTENEEKTDETDEFCSESIEPITRSTISKTMIDVLTDDEQLLQEVMKQSPLRFNPVMQGESLHEYTKLALDNLRRAMNVSSDPKQVINYLRENPIEVDAEIAEKLERASEYVAEVASNSCGNDNDEGGQEIMPIDKIVQSVINRTISNNINRNELELRYETQLQTLKEMGFHDDTLESDKNRLIDVVNRANGDLSQAICELLSV